MPLNSIGSFDVAFLLADLSAEQNEPIESAKLPHAHSSMQNLNAYDIIIRGICSVLKAARFRKLYIHDASTTRHSFVVAAALGQLVSS